ncbi:hypothetical protein D3C80_1294410 [compost metagenome]
MTLFEELIELLSDDVVIETFQETDRLLHFLVETYPVTRWGRIDWEAVSDKHVVVSVQEVAGILESNLGGSNDLKVNLLWNYSDAPSIRVSLNQVVKYIDDVLAVGSDTWITCPDFSFVIEFFHEGEIVLGFRK